MAILVENRKIFKPYVFSTPDEGAPWNFVMALALKKENDTSTRKSRVWQYVQSFRHSTGIGRTDRWTCHNNIALCMHCMLMRDNNTLLYENLAQLNL